MSILILALSLILFLQSISISLSDIKHRRIPNKQLALLMITTSLIALYSDFLPETLVHSLILLGVGYMLFSLRIWGGGDAKLLFVFAIAIKPDALWVALFSGIIAASIQIIATLIYHKGIRNANKVGIAFGVPIAVSGLTGVYVSLLLTI